MFDSLESLVNQSAETGMPFWKIIMMGDAADQGILPEEDFRRMLSMYQAMQASAAGYDPDQRSTSGLSGGDAALVKQAAEEGRLVSGPFISAVIVKALMIGESNACMKRIVAAPTAGSCGVLPAVLMTYQEKEEVSDEMITQALFTAAGIGGVIAQRACLSGAEGGCQAEIGSASAMAAGALTGLRGGTAHQIANAAALALKSLLGLVCDPVGGLVEVPCIKRNVIGAVNAVTAGDMAISGVESRIPADEVIDAMKSIGHMMNRRLRETGEGGLAVTETARRFSEQSSE